MGLIDKIEGSNNNQLSIHKTLKENLPSSVEVDNNEIHFTEDGGIYINDKYGNLTQCGVTRDEFEEVKQDVSNGKEIIATAITDKGVQASGDDTFATLGDKIREIETSGGLEINGATDIEVVCGADLLRGDVVKIVNHDNTFESINRTDINPNPDVLPAGTGNECSFGVDGNYLAVAHTTAPNITIYKRDGDTFTKLPDPDVLPAGTGNGCSFGGDGNYLAIAHSTEPNITIYKRNGDTFTKLPDPDILPTSSGNGCSFSEDGNYLAVAHNTSPYVTIYKRNGDTFTKLANPDMLPSSTGYNCSFSPSGDYLAITNNGTPYITIYKRNGDTFTKLPDPDILPAGTGRRCNFSPDGNYLAIAHGGSLPYIAIYKITNTGIHAYKQTTTDYFNKVEGLGIMNESGVKDELKIVKKILNREELLSMAIERENNQPKDSEVIQINIKEKGMEYD